MGDALYMDEPSRVPTYMNYLPSRHVLLHVHVPCFLIEFARCMYMYIDMTWYNSYSHMTV